jgi:uncharacterized membrane protein YesL
MGGVVLANLIWGVAVLPWLAVAALLFGLAAALPADMVPPAHTVAVVMVVILVWLSPPSVIIYAAALMWVRGESATWALVGGQVRRSWLRALALGCLAAGAGGLLVVNLFFYLSFGGLVGMALGGVMVWALLALGLVGLYCLPVLITQDNGVFKTIQQSFLLALANVKMSLLMAVGMGIAGSLAVFSVVGGLVGIWGGAVLFECACFIKVLGRYTGKEPVFTERSWNSVLRPWED